MATEGASTVDNRTTGGEIARTRVEDLQELGRISRDPRVRTVMNRLEVKERFKQREQLRPVVKIRRVDTSK